MATHVSQKFRTYTSGKALSEDFRQTVCDDLIANGAPAGAGYFPSLYSLSKQTGDKFRIAESTVVKYWTQLCLEGNVKPKKKGGSKGKLSDQALALIELYGTEQPSITGLKVNQKKIGRSWCYFAR
jgi:hypothetical protein